MKLFRPAASIGQRVGLERNRKLRISKNKLVLGATLMGVAAAFAEAGAGQRSDLRLPGVLFNRLVSEKNVAVQRGLAFGPLARQKLDLYQATPGADRKAIVIFYYGGGWRRGERATYRFVGAALAAQGFTAVIPDYRLYPEFGFPDFMQDAALAYQWVQQNLNADGQNRPVVLMGHSAGAHMAALLAVDPAYLAGAPRPAAVVGLAGPYSFDPTSWPRTRDIFRSAMDNPDKARPVAFVSAEAPPMFFARGAQDDVVAAFNADDMTEALREKGVRVENRLYPGVGHPGLALALSRPFRKRAPVLADCLAFLDRILAAPRPSS
jgi:acetyl esterase/lipase